MHRSSWERVARLRPALVASVAARGLTSATARIAAAPSTARASTARTAASRSSASRSCRTSSCSSPASPAPASTASGAAGRDAHWPPLCTLQCTVRPGLWHRLRQALRRARCIPSARLAAARLPPPRVGRSPPFQPSLSPAIPPTFRQRGAFAAADERAKGTVHFSDNDKKFGKKGKKGKKGAREIQLTNMRNAL